MKLLHLLFVISAITTVAMLAMMLDPTTVNPPSHISGIIIIIAMWFPTVLTFVKRRSAII